MAAEKKVARASIYGYHPVEEALQSGERGIGVLFLARGRDDRRVHQLAKLARERGVKIRVVESRELDRLAPGKAHQGVVATVEAKQLLDLEDFLRGVRGERRVLVVILDGVQDPHNFGAVVRSGALCGARAVIFPKDRTAGVTPTVEKVASGALEYIDLVRVGNLAAALRRMKKEGFWVVGADPGAKVEIQELDYQGRVAVVLGEEHGGLRRLTREHCDETAVIPSTGKVGSYNMSAAAALFLFFAFLRQRTRP